VESVLRKTEDFTMEERICERGSFWAGSGRVNELCIAKEWWSNSAIITRAWRFDLLWISFHLFKQKRDDKASYNFTSIHAYAHIGVQLLQQIANRSNQWSWIELRHSLTQTCTSMLSSQRKRSFWRQRTLRTDAGRNSIPSFADAGRQKAEVAATKWLAT